MRSERNVRSLKHNKRAHHDLMNYKNSKSLTYYENNYHSKRIKRVDQDSDCDNEGFTSLIIGCNSIDTMEFRSECFSPDLISCKFIISVFLFCNSVVVHNLYVVFK